MDTDGGDLLVRAAAGDRSAFDTFVRRWERPLGRFLLRVTGSAERAEEARQVTFVRVLTSAGSFRGGGVSSWLFRTALRIAIDLRRSEARRRTAPLDGDFPLADGAPDPADAAATADEGAHVRRALERLEPEERALLWLRVADERSFASTAAVLGIPESTARVRFLRALGRLRRELGPRAML